MRKLLAVALLSAGLSLAAAQSWSQCRMNPSVCAAGTYSKINGSVFDPNTATYQQVVQWCRYPEGGANTGGSNATRWWADASSAPGAMLNAGGAPVTAPYDNQVASGSPQSRAGSGPFFNSNCQPNGTVASGGLDGPSMPNHYAGGAVACTQGTDTLNPTYCPTGDNWGSLVDTCVIPGDTLGQYPTTLSLDDVCDRKVLVYDLVTDIKQVFPVVPVGKIYIFKDYQDVLFVTIQLNATFQVNLQTATNNEWFNGQYLHPQPTLVPGQNYSGNLHLWTNYTQKALYQYQDQIKYQKDITGKPVQALFSCFTYKINTKTLCNPETTVGHGLESACTRRDGGANLLAGDVINAQWSKSLLMRAAFTVVKFTMKQDSTAAGTDWNITAPGVPAANYSANIVCPQDQNTANPYPIKQLDGCGCFDLNTVAPTGSGKGTPSTLTVVPDWGTGVALTDLYAPGGLSPVCENKAHLAGSPKPPPPGTPSPSPGASPAQTIFPILSPSPAPPASPVITPPPASQLFTCAVDVVLDPDFYDVNNIVLTPSILLDAWNKTFKDCSSGNFFPTMVLRTATLTSTNPLTFQLLYYWPDQPTALKAITEFKRRVHFFIYYASIPCGTVLKFYLGTPDVSFPKATLACSPVDAGVEAESGLCLFPKGHQLCQLPTASTAVTSDSPMPVMDSPVPEQEFWPTPPNWFEFYIKTAIRQDNGLADIASGNKQGTVNKVMINICPFFKSAVLEALNRVGAPPEAYIQDLYGDMFNGCGDVLLNQPANNNTLPDRVYIKAFLNISSTQFSKMRKKFSYPQSRPFVQDSHILCNSNLTWVDPVTNPSAPPKKTVFTQVGLPWLRKTYTPLSCKLKCGL